MAAHVGFDVFGLPALASFSLPTNLPSRRVMERAECRYERDFVYKGYPQVLYRQNAAMWADLPKTRSDDLRY